MRRNYHYYTILIGLLVSFAALIADFISSSTVGFGFIQTSIITTGLVICFYGIRKLYFPSKNKLDWIFVLAYMLSLYLAGLYSNVYSLIPQNEFLSFKRFHLKDAMVNIIGFAPFGYLLSHAFLTITTLKKSIYYALLSAISVSFTIELVQYCCMHSRHSSGIDLLANSIGSIIGVTVFYFLYVSRR